VPQVNVLLHILSREVYLVQGFAHIGRAHHAGVSVGHITTTQVTRIPVCVQFHSFREWGAGGTSTLVHEAVSSCTMPSRGWHVLRRPCLMVCWGCVEKGGSSAMIRRNHCSRAMGITACGWDITTAKLASIDCCLGTTLLAPATPCPTPPLFKLASLPCSALFWLKLGPLTCTII
jgi:hypothetical protein